MKDDAAVDSSFVQDTLHPCCRDVWFTEPVMRSVQGRGYPQIRAALRELCKELKLKLVRVTGWMGAIVRHACSMQQQSAVALLVLCFHVLFSSAVLGGCSLSFLISCQPLFFFK